MPFPPFSLLLSQPHAFVHSSNLSNTAPPNSVQPRSAQDPSTSVSGFLAVSDTCSVLFWFGSSRMPSLCPRTSLSSTHQGTPAVKGGTDAESQLSSSQAKGASTTAPNTGAATTVDASALLLQTLALGRRSSLAGSGPGRSAKWTCPTLAADPSGQRKTHWPSAATV
ncbi:uncharacterized protein UTRI_10272 [Ustilago trichophora]|uniref:Uncharacterized protein n=1 Tax=Ustilago trichophora TaxID=86804 RepID=A0A5C3ENQ9_9BASI|nr:uncharacterized protein UTRI_10272 [Ustilago trichophora]